MITLNHQSDYSIGGFVGYIAESPSSPFTLTDNFTTGSYVDAVGLYGTYPDYIGGMTGYTLKKNTDTFTNNYYANYDNDCTGKSSPQKPTCTKVADTAFQNKTHDVYTRAGNAWNFTTTWKTVPDGLPELR